jgi:hypothetical protein
METLKNTTATLLTTIVLTFITALLVGAIANLFLGSFNISLDNAIIFLGVSFIYSFSLVYNTLNTKK